MGNKGVPQRPDQNGEIAEDTGYLEICGSCKARYGGPVYGEREIAIVTCQACTDRDNSARHISSYNRQKYISSKKKKRLH